MSKVSRTRVKICGIRTVADAVYAAQSGADAIGLVFFAPSPRYVDFDTAQAIISSLPPFVARVGLFVNADRDDIVHTAASLRLDLIQFHGDESAADCEAVGLPYIKAIQVKESDDILRAQERYLGAKGLLLDAWHPTLHGGTGERFDWSLVPDNLDLPLILAGGLNADNVAAAISQVRPYAVDVSGGVEQQKGVKDRQKIHDFIAAASAL